METKVNQIMFCESRGALLQLIDVLSGKNGALWLEGISSYLHQGAIKAFGWEVYESLDLEQIDNLTSLMIKIREKLKKHKEFAIYDYLDIRKLSKQIIYPVESVNSDFVVLSVENLGFKENARFSEIKECLDGLKLCPCHQSDGPRLFISNDERLKNIGIHETIIFSEPFFCSHGDKRDNVFKRPLMFTLRFSPVRFLFAHWIECDYQEGDTLGRHNQDMLFSPSHRLLLRVKK